MNNNSKIIIDYLNIYTVLYIVFHDYESVVVLYRHKFLESFYTSILERLKVKVVKSSVMYSDNKSASIYTATTIEKYRVLMDIFQSKDLISDFLYRKFYYDRIHPIVELKFILKDELFDKILINYPNYLINLKLDDDFYSKFGFYSLISFVFKGEKRYEYRNYYFNKNINLVKSFLRIIKVFSDINFLKKSREDLKADILIYTHPSSMYLREYMNILHFLKKSSISYIELNPHNLHLTYNGKSSYLYSLAITEFFQYLKIITTNYKNTFASKNNSIDFFSYIILSLKNIFFLDKAFKEANIKITFTCYEGDDLLYLINLLCYKSNEIVSTSSSWSLGDGQRSKNLFYNAFKECDIFFAWGEYHQKQALLESHYNSIVYTGYIGDYFLNKMKYNTREIIRRNNFHNKKIISVYDYSVRIDSYVTYSQLNNYYLGLAYFLETNKEYTCIIKSKRGDLYSYLDESISYRLKRYNNRIIYMDQYADLGPALVSDLVYALSLNSLGFLASVYGKKVIFYDEGKIIGKKMLPKNAIIIDNPKDLINMHQFVQNTKVGNVVNSEIDPYTDGKSLDRIVEYLKLLLLNNGKDKKAQISITNNVYMDKYGEDKVFIKS